MTAEMAGGEPPPLCPHGAAAWTCGDPATEEIPEVAGGEPTRPSEQDWLAAIDPTSNPEWTAYNRGRWRAIAPLIERERADAAARVVEVVEAEVLAMEGSWTNNGDPETGMVLRSNVLAVVRAARGATGKPT